MSSTARSHAAKKYHVLYQSKHWQTVRRQVLTRDQYKCQQIKCNVHLTAGRQGPNSAVVHHIKPHRGDLELFFDFSNLQAVCKSCHDGELQSIESRGYDTQIGNDGWPTDPKHPSVK